ncbi:hypothetical protein [Marinobacterium stanieri]|uniref:hypothetical protein n=1 Tax=Marinobacterium stanieri TaxID=49186 RepID=UPI003A93C0D7
MFDEYKKYERKAHMAMSQVSIVFDLARAAEKMCEWKNIGNRNEAWSEGPFIEAPANKSKIDRSFPYVVTTSIETQVIAKRVDKVFQRESENGMKKIDLPEIDGSRVEPYIAKAAIIEQFELFKEICVFFHAPFNKKRAEKLRGVVDDVLLDRLVFAATRRNELTHQDECKPPTMREAVEYFYDITELAVQFGSLANDGVFDNKPIQPTADASAD